MTEQTDVPALRITRTFDASRERVFAAWIEQQQFQQFIGCCPGKGNVAEGWTGRVGDAFTVTLSLPDGGSVVATGSFLEVDPPVRLRYSWRTEMEPPDEITTVTVELEERDGRTALTLTHVGPQIGRVPELVEAGWGAALEALGRLLAAGT